MYHAQVDSNGTNPRSFPYDGFKRKGICHMQRENTTEDDRANTPAFDLKSDDSVEPKTWGRSTLTLLGGRYGAYVSMLKVFLRHYIHRQFSATATSVSLTAQETQTSSAGSSTSQSDARGDKYSMSDKIALGVGIGIGLPTMILTFFTCWHLRHTSHRRSNRRLRPVK